MKSPVPPTVRLFVIVTSSGKPIVTVLDASATSISFDVPLNVTVSPLATAVEFVPSLTVHVYVPGIPLIGAQALSPLKYTVASGVPVADKSKVIIGLGLVPVIAPVIKLPDGK